MNNSYKDEKSHRNWLRTVVAVGAMVLATIFNPEMSGAQQKTPKFGPNAVKVPKNIIYLISDGMGYNHTLSTNYYEGKTQAYEAFPMKYGMSTYSAAMGDPATNPEYAPGYDPNQAWKQFDYLKSKPTDSAPAATAMSSGVKTYNGSIGIDMNRQPVTHITEVAQLKGKATGVITSVQFSHATPAGFVAHNVSRNNYAEIAKEMILDSKCKVIMGCGHPDYNDNGEVRTKKEYKYIGDSATWAGLKNGDVLINGNVVEDIDGDGVSDAWTLIDNRTDFQAIANGTTTAPNRLLGVPRAATTLQQVRSGDGAAAPGVVAFNQNVPTLVEMTNASLKVLNSDPDGFFLMIEGGAIDWASHANQSGRMIEEQMEFNRTVDAVINWVETNSSWDETMVMVTGDHETGFLWGANSGGSTFNPITDNGAGAVPGMTWYSGDHTNSLIGFYAKGAGSELFELYADEADSVRGRFINNTETAQVMFDLWPKAEFHPVKVPKNIIYMISDGMGYNHVLSTDYYQGKSQIYEAFPVKYAMSTYSAAMGDPTKGYEYGAGYNPGIVWKDFEYLKKKPTDSAPAATAMSTGIKTYNGAIGVDMTKQPLTHITEIAQLKGKATGVITSVQFSHATPAGFVAHNASRNNYADIANEMILDSRCQVIMGCGHPDYNDNGEVRTTKDYKYVGGDVTWNGLKAGQTTINGNTVEDIDGDGGPDVWALVEDRSAFQALVQGTTPKRVIGVPKAATTLQQARQGVAYPAGIYDPSQPGQEKPGEVSFIGTVPTLEEMAKAALNVLDNDPNGMFLMIEGGAIDWASHANQSGRMIEEQMEFNRAVEAVVNWVETNSNWNETMVIVTGDHECGYLWGPNAGGTTFAPIADNGAGLMPKMQWYSGDHSNSLIPFYAKGAGSELYHLFADEVDPVKGRFVNNTETAQAMFLLWDDSYTTLGVDDIPGGGQKPTGFNLDQNYPNPFNPSTTINFTLLKSGRAVLEVYNVLGQKVATVFDKMLDKGQHSYRWNAKSLSSGVYFYKLVSGNYSATKKLMLLK
ncbi:MAG: T9SS type A sorting domain-containing protein [Chlorobiales bacterium]|jgi:alkaline phosphatase|nr:T9SS type A sorting domain-containing protein [Chlorobiales bacterium]